MVLKNTRATEHYFTVGKLRSLVLASGIVKASAELKSISGKSQQLGYQAEQQVLLYMQNAGWSPAFLRLKTTVAEIDLVLEKEGNVLLLEIKKLNDPWRSFERISSSQQLKLQKNLILFSLIRIGMFAERPWARNVTDCQHW